MATDITADDLINAALSPQSASADGQSVTRGSIKDLKDALATKATARGVSGWSGLSKAYMVPPGSTGPNATDS